MLPYAVVILGGNSSLLSYVRQGALIAELASPRPLIEQANSLVTVHVHFHAIKRRPGADKAFSLKIVRPAQTSVLHS